MEIVGTAVKLRLASYNIHRAIGVDRLFRPLRIAEVLAAHEADVVLLQEVDDGVPRSRRLDLGEFLARELGFAHYAIGHNVRLRYGRYGNATLSRFPIERARNIDLSIGRRKRRGCQYTALLFSNEAQAAVRLEVFNLHLGLSAQERSQQLGLLASAPEFARLRPDQPCIVGGDFNDWRSLLRPTLTNALRFRCATDHKTVAGMVGIRTYPSFSPQGPLDRFYYRGRLHLLNAYRCRHALSRVASDHLPILADFSLR